MPSKDKFRGKVDFKDILRRFDPKDEERSFGGGGGGGSMSNLRMNRPRHESEPRDYQVFGGPQRGAIVDSDFDFRGGASREPVWDNPGRFRASRSSGGHRSLSPGLGRGRVQPLQLDIDVANKINSAFSSSTTSLRRSESNPISPRRCESNPISPRRVEFAEEIIFDFNPSKIRSNVVSPVEKVHFKPILRHTTEKEDHGLSVQHANRDTSRDGIGSQVNSDSLVQIFVPQNVGEDEDTDVVSDTNSADTDDTIEFKSDNTLKRSVPPPLGDLDRSQSFPPPAAASSADRKTSLPENLKLAEKCKSFEGNKSKVCSKYWLILQIRLLSFQTCLN